jgi:hypothetical protein
LPTSVTRPDREPANASGIAASESDAARVSLESLPRGVHGVGHPWPAACSGWRANSFSVTSSIFRTVGERGFSMDDGGGQPCAPAANIRTHGGSTHGNAGGHLARRRLRRAGQRGRRCGRGHTILVEGGLGPDLPLGGESCRYRPLPAPSMSSAAPWAVTAGTSSEVARSTENPNYQAPRRRTDVPRRRHQGARPRPRADPKGRPLNPQATRPGTFDVPRRKWRLSAPVAHSVQAWQLQPVIHLASSGLVLAPESPSEPAVPAGTSPSSDAAGSPPGPAGRASISSMTSKPRRRSLGYRARIQHLRN